MENSGSFVGHSFREVTHNVYCSAVIAVPAATVAKTLKDIESMKRYGTSGGIIGCCVMENLTPPTEVGAVRRCTLRLAPYRDKLIREKLTRSEEHRHRVGEDGDTSPYGTGELKSVELTVEYVPCEGGDRQRCVFEPSVEDAIRNVSTTIRISTVTRSPHRCFVEMDAVCAFLVHHGRHVSAEEKLQDKACQHALSKFWQLYLDAQLRALEQQVLKEMYPEVQTQVELDVRSAFAHHEEVLCTWATERQETLPRSTAVEELESVLVWWSRVMDAYKHQKTLVEVAEAQADRSKAAAFGLTRPLPRRFTDAEKSGIPGRGATDKLGNGGVGSTEANNLSDSTHPSQSGLDVPLTAFTPPRSFSGAPPSPSVVAGALDSRGGTTMRSEDSRQSVLLPRDRRHTAVPKKSFTSATTIPENGPPTKALSPASSFLASPNTGAASISNAHLSSGGSYSARRKPQGGQPSHLLQQAQRRASNLNSLNNSVSRQHAPNPSRARHDSTDATGVFFSQFFSTPTYTASAPSEKIPPKLPNISSPTGRTGSSSSAAAAGAAAAATSSSSSHALNPQHHGSTALPATGPAAAPEGLETFQPEMVRQLYTLTGVLQENVARRIFSCLASQEGDNAPLRLHADGLKSVLRYMDSCGLREGSSVSYSGAAACEEAYRAEVHRCYFEQTKNPAVGKNGSPVRPPSEDQGMADEVSTLSALAARRAATLREGDEVALDKMVKSIFSRFAFHKKTELTYDEFQMALLYLARN